MSEKAYQRLLEANKLLENDQRDEAITAYRDVLRLEPSPPQRQVAEAQLRHFGELPYTFASSGRVIHRQSSPKMKKKHREKKRKSHSNKERKQEVTEPKSSKKTSSKTNKKTKEFSQKQPNPSNNSEKERSVAFQKAIREAEKKLPENIKQQIEPPRKKLSTEQITTQASVNLQKNNNPPSNPNENNVQEKISNRPTIINIENNDKTDSFLSKKDTIPKSFNDLWGTSTAPVYGTEQPWRQLEDVLLKSRTEKRLRELGKLLWRSFREENTLSKLKKKHISNSASELNLFVHKPDTNSDHKNIPLAVPPQQRKNENNEDFLKRQERYEIWESYKKRYPDIDLNTAIRLKEEGLTLKEFREIQSNKKKKHRKQHKKLLQSLKQKNVGYVGTLHTELLIEKRIPLWIHGFKTINIQGYLLENKVYYWIVKSYKSKNRKIRKIDLIVVCRKNQRMKFKLACRVEKEQALKKELPSPKREKRFQIKDSELHSFEKKRTPLYIQFYDGVWLKGQILWYDPYQLGVQVLNDTDDDDDGINVMIFRHAISNIQQECPKTWDQWISLQEHHQS